MRLEKECDWQGKCSVIWISPNLKTQFEKSCFLINDKKNSCSTFDNKYNQLDLTVKMADEIDPGIPVPNSADNWSPQFVNKYQFSFETIAFYTSLLHPHNYTHIIGY